MYDAIVVGARCAGSPTAMLLARKGYRVLLVDRARFPSDAVSTHIVWPPGVARLRRWGLLERIVASGCPAIRRLRFDVGPFALVGAPPAIDGVSEAFAPRRRVLDAILVEAAAESGAELRERCSFEGVVTDGERVTGIRCRTAQGGVVTEAASIVIGADGRYSSVARAVKAPEHHARPPLACWYYGYWSGVPLEGVEYYVRPGRTFGALPTHDGLACVPLGCAQREVRQIRADVEGAFWRTLDLVPGLAERIRQGTRAERFAGALDVASFFRKSSGPGWALVGDAGYHKDPITAQGISDAFHAADGLAEALDAGLSGREPLPAALARWERRRDEAALPMYELTCQMAALDPLPPALQQFLAASRESQAETDRFFGALAGTLPIADVLSPENVQRVIGSATA